ncbi:hypothetical protein [Mucilaginibacter dorajii]|uniref:Uncharacterized protein n=1 Tax=Mucilaginibacter dorajii TaxID=692994 RepID=A0ABP7R627_9SPHI|nr:hypothetical protein [Mucilaginibacter dorajii]MCS3737695.1 hypothetical protein [Mucilaginibacter dorajii]
MIKIELKNIPKLKQDYFKAIGVQVIFRLEILQTALLHITGKGVTPAIPHFREVATVTRKIINQMRTRQVGATRFKAKTYRRTVMFYTNPKRFTPFVKFQDLLDLVEKLLDKKNGEMLKLLTCSASRLYQTNDDLETTHNILGKAEKEVLALAFDYQAYNKITDEIKLFFRTRNLVHYCPYCNMEPAMYSGSPSGKTVRVHQLDHFFDKASYPLLCYSLFNLVPGDWTCNTINKGTTAFTDEISLNPYTAGFGKAMVFEPDYDRAGMKMVELKVVVDPKAPKKIRRQLLGTKLRFNEDDEEGNINVFGLYSKYNLPHVTLEAARVHRRFLDNLNNLPSLHQFMKKLPRSQAFDHYRSWYEEYIRAPFEPKRFHEQRYSKMFRDLHDFVFEHDKQPHNDLIREIGKHFS